MEEVIEIRGAFLALTVAEMYCRTGIKQTKKQTSKQTKLLGIGTVGFF